jgi:hypothetical protein
MTTAEKIRKLDPKHVARVYSGINGRCCCGCSGTYWCRKIHREIVAKHQGYPISDKEVSDRQVTRIFRIFQENAEQARELAPGHFTFVDENRLYMLMTLESF